MTWQPGQQPPPQEPPQPPPQEPPPLPPAPQQPPPLPPAPPQPPPLPPAPAQPPPQPPAPQQPPPQPPPPQQRPPYPAPPYPPPQQPPYPPPQQPPYPPPQQPPYPPPQQPPYPLLYPPPYPPPQQQPYAAIPYPEPRRTNGFAIAGFVFSIPAIVFLSVPLAIVGLVQTKGGRHGGRGLAIAALVISGAWVVLLVALTAMGALGAITGSVTVNAAQLKVGDCIKDEPAGTRVRSVDTTRCDQPHWGEVYAVLTMPDGPYPGQSGIDNFKSQCEPALGTYSPMALKNPAIDTTVVTPTADSWGKGDRGFICIATTTTKRTASIKG